MLKRIICLFLVFIFVLPNLFQPKLRDVKAQPDGPQAEVHASLHNDTSLPLAQLAAQAGMRQRQPLNAEEAPPALRIPRDVQGYRAEGDDAVQLAPVLPRMPATLADFEGVGNVDFVMPPDTQGDIGFDPLTGTKYYVQWVNLSYQIWDVTNPATPVSLLGPLSGDSLWNGFGGACETTNDGDPITLFDPLAKRWLMSQFAFPNGSAMGPFYQCIAISQTANPTGAWHRYAFLASNTKMNDYPKFGVWPDAFYMTVNQFVGTNWGGAGVFAFERSRMLAGQPASMVYFDLFAVNPNIGGMLPADLDGLTPPPAGTPGLFAEVDDASWVGPQDAIRLWEFDVDWNNPSNATFGNAAGSAPAIANVYLPVNSFDLLPCVVSGSSLCIPQPGTTMKLDSLGDRAMYRLAYRNFGTHQSLVFNHTVRADGSDRAGVRWYELRNSGSGWILAQQSTFAPGDGLYRWMGSAAMDAVGNIALGYSRGSLTTFASIAATGRLADDAAGQMTQGELLLKAGAGSQTGGSRWGDYSMMAVDPQDDCTFWFTSEYMAATSNNAWHTRINAFRFDSCTGMAVGEISGQVTNAATGAPIVGAVARSNGYESLTGSDGRYVLTLPVGTYTVEVSAYGYASQSAAGLDVTETGVITRDFSLTALPQTMVHGVVYENGTHGWPLYARLDVTADNYAHTVYSDPLDGSYSLDLMQGVVYQFSVIPVLDGYIDADTMVTTAGVDQTVDFPMTVDMLACMAPGYRFESGLAEDFASHMLPAGWQVTDETGTGAVWVFDSSRPNQTGGLGGYAMADSDKALTIDMTTALVSPSVDFSGESTVALQFSYDYYDYFATSEAAYVDISINAGEWQNVWVRNTIDRGPKTANIDLTALAAGQPDVRMRFRYANANYSWYWQVDNILLGTPLCMAQPGGLVAGVVADAQTLDGISGASIRSDDGSETISFIPSGDERFASLYFLFQPLASSLEEHMISSVGVANYPDYPLQVNVAENMVTWQDFYLGAAFLSVTPTSLLFDLEANAVGSDSFTIENVGLLAADVTLQAVLTSQYQASAVMENPTAVVKPFKQGFADAEILKLPAETLYPAWGSVTVLEHWPSPLKQTWAVLPVQNGRVWLSSSGTGWNGANQLYYYDPSDWSGMEEFAYDWQPYYGPADVTWDVSRNVAWAADVERGGAYCMRAVDLENGQTDEKICPQGLLGSPRGLAYDPLSDTFFAGGWNDGMVYRFNRQGEVLQAQWLRHAVAGLAYHPISRRLYVMVNASPTKLVVIDTADEDWPVLGEMRLDNWFLDYGGAGIELDCSGNLWAVDQRANRVYQLDVGETSGVCALDTAPWLTITPDSFNIAVGSSQVVEVVVDSSGMRPGVYLARIQVLEDTPYTVSDLLVRLVVDGGWPKMYLPIIRR
ncbi:MAG: hypothetical protein CVU39_12915 [Chloroflexi bacterium HGW-Chloroflexi-10]|nr:MAG: hypothetical protein CVU39_12915 [Chloroflexi bacterium HGW-Chloroflexi-10]